MINWRNLANIFINYRVPYDFKGNCIKLTHNQWIVIKDFHILTIWSFHPNFSSKHSAESRTICHWRDFWMLYFLEACNPCLHIFSAKSDKCSFVSHLITIVRRWEYCKHSSSLLILKSFWLYFMTSYKQFEIIIVKEFLCYIRSKLDTYSSLAWMSTILITRIWPKSFTHDPFIRWLSSSVLLLYIF